MNSSLWHWSGGQKSEEMVMLEGAEAALTASQQTARSLAVRLLAEAALAQKKTRELEGSLEGSHLRREEWSVGFQNGVYQRLSYDPDPFFFKYAVTARAWALRKIIIVWGFL